MKESEYKKIRRFFKSNKSEKNIIALTLIEEYEFTEKLLIKLKEEIHESNSTIKIEQGKQKLTIENPAIKTYNTTLRNYMSLSKKITDLLPGETQKNEKDEFEDF